LSPGQLYLILTLITGVLAELLIVGRNELVYGDPNSEDWPTLSRVIWRTCQAHPWLAFVAGALAWHFLGS
jgi:hypothetical protein